jgi:hypothetical protein
LLRLLDVRAGDRIRTGDVQLGNAAAAEPLGKQDKNLRREVSALARCLHAPAEIDPDLARVLDAWPVLAEPIRIAILVLVESADPRRP